MSPISFSFILSQHFYLLSFLKFYRTLPLNGKMHFAVHISLHFYFCLANSSSACTSPNPLSASLTAQRHPSSSYFCGFIIHPLFYISAQNSRGFTPSCS